MNRRMLRNTAAVCVALFVGASVFCQGLYWESTTSGAPLGQREIGSQSFYMPHMFKTVSGDDGSVMIFRLDKQVIYSIDPKEKTYSETTFSEWEANMKKASAKMGARMDELRKKMESMPEEQRKMMEQMMGDQMPGKAKDTKVDVSKTGETKNIAGYAATKFSITEDGKETMALWAAKNFKGYDSMKNDLEEFSTRMLSGDFQGSKGLVDAFRKVDGFPMEVDLKGGIKNTVTKVERRDIGASEFEVPSGYTKVASKIMEEKDNDKE